MRLGTTVSIFANRLCRHANCGLSNLQLCCTRAFADSFNNMAIAISGGEFHPQVGINRVLAEQRIDEANALEEISPIKRREQTHAGDDVAYGNLSCSLTLVLEMNDLFDAGI